MKQLDKSGAENQYVRDEVFLYVWAPVMTEYVEWVLEEALKEGKSRLYFLARDGYMMYRLAKKMVKARNLKLDIRYLKISRFAIRSAEYYFSGEAALDTLCTGGMGVSFETIMKRANLTEEEGCCVAKLAGYDKTYKEILNSRQLCRLKTELSCIDQLFVFIQKHSKGCYETAVSYFKQEGLFQEISYALVDSGWTGTLQFSLQKVLEHEAAKQMQLQGYYFGLYERPKGTKKEQYKAFFFCERDIFKKIRFSNCLFETVFSSPEGMTCGYEKTGKKGLKLSEKPMQNNRNYWAYVALENENKNPNAAVMERFTELLLNYGAAYLETANLRSMPDNGAAVSERHRRKKQRFFVESLLKPVMGSPTQMEAEVFGELQFCDDMLERQLQSVAAVWDERELRKQRFLNKLFIKMNLKTDFLQESAWAEGSIVNLGGKVKKNLRQERLYKSFRYVRKAVIR